MKKLDIIERYITNLIDLNDWLINYQTDEAEFHLKRWVGE